jgi:hypothetical protein
VGCFDLKVEDGDNN